jgi:tripartite-type tricarboxylate transporter receptor subunit TctC
MLPSRPLSPSLPRRAVLAAFVLLAPALATAAQAQIYPSRPITVVSGYAPGAASDFLARIVGDALQTKWGQPYVVENRPGSGSNIAAAYVARSAPDGHTLMVANDATLTSNVHLFKATPFDPAKDFAPIINICANIIVLVVNPDLPVKTVADLIDYAKKNPGKLSYGSSGVGSPHHLAGELLAQMADIKLTHIPYKGGGLAANDVMGGHIPMAFLSLVAARALADAGKIRIVAVVESTRYDGLPDVPRIGETVPGFEMASFVGIIAPAGTPQPVVARLNETIAAALKNEAVSRKFAELGLAVVASSPEEFARTIKEGIAVRGRLVKAAGIAPE